MNKNERNVIKNTNTDKKINKISKHLLRQTLYVKIS